jgi:pseudouridine kinase
MDSKKEQLLDLIRANPFVGQQELAEQLGLSRSAVAGHIAGLTREGRLLGRAYVLPGAAAPILCIGGSNLDRKLRSLQALQMGESNPAEQRETPGGVARNVAENLARLGLPVGLLSAVGDDAAGRGLLDALQALGVDTRGALRLPGRATGSYTAVLDPAGAMVLALAEMAITEALTPEFLRQCAPQRAAAALSVADLNLPADSLALLAAEALAQQRALLLVAVSAPKMARLPEDLRGVACLLLNEGELAAVLGRPLAAPADIDAAWQRLRARGLQRMVLTRGRAGVLHAEGEAPLQALAAPPVPVREVTGAGDAFAAGVAASLYQQPQDLALACRRGLALSALTLQTEATVHPDLSPALLAQIT